MILYLPSFLGGLAIILGALLTGALTGYWHLPIWLVLAGGASLVYISLHRGIQRGRRHDSLVRAINRQQP